MGISWWSVRFRSLYQEIATGLRPRNDEVREAGAPVWAWAVIEGGRWGHDPTLLWRQKKLKKKLTILKSMLKY